jgi:NAD(P)-dependent dehydrogenase (short-subunit alcohol dehydrogenase family)
MDLALTGRRAIVAGASRGIGLAIATALRTEGASVAICARDHAALEEARAALEVAADGGVVFARATDLADADDTRTFVRDAIEALGGLDIYIHSASGFGDPTEQGWLRTLEIDLLAAVRGIEVALPSLDSSDAASIVLIGSTASVQNFGRAGSGATGYGPAKAAQRVLVNDLAQSLGRRRIRANAVSPGSTIFEGGTWARVRDEDPQLWDGLVRQFPFRHLVTADEVARAVVFVASPAGSGINGTHIIVDGGQNKAVQ